MAIVSGILIVFWVLLAVTLRRAQAAVAEKTPMSNTADASYVQQVVNASSAYPTYLQPLRNEPCSNATPALPASASAVAVAVDENCSLLIASAAAGASTGTTPFVQVSVSSAAEAITAEKYGVVVGRFSSTVFGSLRSAAATTPHVLVLTTEPLDGSLGSFPSNMRSLSSTFAGSATLEDALCFARDAMAAVQDRVVESCVQYARQSLS